MLGFLCVLVPFTFRDRPGNWPLLVMYAAGGGLLFVYQRVRVPWFDFPKRFRQVYPVLYIAVIFDSLVHVVPHVHTWRADALLRRIDRMMLGVDPTIYLERYLGPVLVELFTYVYILYFVLPFLLVWGLWRERKLTEITHWACLITIALYSNYVLYIVFPAVGPRLHITHSVDKLQGAFMANSLIYLLNHLESNKFDVFPSAHVNAALVTLYGFARFYKKFTVPVAIAVLGIMVSTVYLRYHYVIDVVAGVALAGIAVAVGELYYRLWRGLPEVERTQPLGEELAHAAR